MSPSADLAPNRGRQEAALLAKKFLDGRIDYERARVIPYSARDFKLDRMRDLLARLGNPHQAVPVVHVAGTKGKGSTTAMIGSVLTAAGYRTGAFTSPHLERVEERLAVDGQACSATELVALVDRIGPAVEAMDREGASCDPPEHGPTYFEVLTAMAMLHFARRKVEAAVLEVGLGGRLDSTNVCRPLVSAITSISFDHMAQLGTTLESIAREKAGIVKPGVPVVSGVLDPAPRGVIRETCRQQGSRLTELGVDFDFDYNAPRNLETAPAMGSLDFHAHPTGGSRDYRGVPIALLGHHQARNAAVALAVLAELAQTGWNISQGAIRAGLGNLTWPARVEVVARRPAVVVDSAHNSASVDALVRVLDESFSAGRRWLVFATSHEKDVRGMLARLLKNFDDVILTRYLNNPRGVPPEELGAMAAELTGRQYSLCPTPADAWQQIQALAKPEDLVCVTGSFFLAAEIRHLLHTQPES